MVKWLLGNMDRRWHFKMYQFGRLLYESVSKSRDAKVMHPDWWNLFCYNVERKVLKLRDGYGGANRYYQYRLEWRKYSYQAWEAKLDFSDNQYNDNYHQSMWIIRRWRANQLGFDRAKYDWFPWVRRIPIGSSHKTCIMVCTLCTGCLQGMLNYSI